MSPLNPRDLPPPGGRITEKGFTPWWPDVWPTPIKKCWTCSPPWWVRLLSGGRSVHGKDHPPSAHADWNGR